MSDERLRTAPETPLSKSDIEEIVAGAIAAERETWEARFIEQEHRGARVIVNWIDALKADHPDRRRSAWLAMLWHFLLPRPTTVAFAAGGILTLLITALGVAMAYRANILLERQNYRIDVQNVLSESQRRTAYFASETAILIPLIDAERGRSIGANDGASEQLPLINLSDALKARVATLSQNLRPYRIANFNFAKEMNLPSDPGKISIFMKLMDFLGLKNDDIKIYDLSDRLYSPERGSLLLSLNSLGISTILIDSLDFSHAIVSGAIIRNLSVSNNNYSFSVFENTKFLHSEFLSYQEGIKINNSTIVDSKMDILFLSQAKLSDVDITGTRLNDDSPPDEDRYHCSAYGVSVLRGVDSIKIVSHLTRCSFDNLRTFGDVDDIKKLKFSTSNGANICIRDRRPGSYDILARPYNEECPGSYKVAKD